MFQVRFLLVFCNTQADVLRFPMSAITAIHANFLDRKEIAHPKVPYIDVEPMRLRRRSTSGTPLFARDHGINIIGRTLHRITKIDTLSRRLPKHHRRHTRRIRNHRMKPIHHQHPSSLLQLPRILT